MRHAMIAAVSAMALLSAPAFAQSTSGTSGAGSSGGGTSGGGSGSGR